MADGNARFRHQLLYPVRYLMYPLDSVEYYINLTAAAHFTLNYISYQRVVLLHDISLNGVPLLGRFFDQAHILDACEGHVESPRYGSGGKG